MDYLAKMDQRIRILWKISLRLLEKYSMKNFVFYVGKFISLLDCCNNFQYINSVTSLRKLLIKAWFNLCLSNIPLLYTL